MIARMLATVAAAALLATAPAATAAPCKDAKGRFIKCPPTKAQPARCRLAGKFVKCGTPGAKPA